MAKQNPILAAYEAKLRAEFDAQLVQLEAYHKQRRHTLTELNIMALMLAAHEELHVGPGRAGAFLRTFLETKKKMAEELTADIGEADRYGSWNGDRDFVKTRHDLAKALKSIFSPEDWDYYKELFPMLEEFW